MARTPPAPVPPHHSAAPALFSDGVANLAIGPGVVKFYLLRLDPSPDSSASPSQVVTAQVIMSIDAFVSTALFFKERLDGMIAEGVVDAAQVARLEEEAGADQ